MSLPDSPAYPAAKELAQTWQTQVEADLKGADFTKRLVTQTYDGIAIAPLYNPLPGDTVEDVGGMPGTFPHTRGDEPLSTSRTGWEIQQTYALNTPKLNDAILRDLGKGVSSVHLVATDDASSLDNTEAALEGVHLNMASVYLSGGRHAEQSSKALSKILRAHAQDATGSFMQDPIGGFAQGHPMAGSAEEALARLGQLSKMNQSEFPKMRTVSVSTEPYHAAGASDAQCLAYAIASGLSYLRAMETEGLNISEAASQIGFHLALDARFFAGISTIRALRTLWSKITDACGTAAGAWIRVHPARRILTKRDPWVNQLRNTATTFAGSVAGANAITTLPWDSTLRPADDFGRRVARNTQLVLEKESHLNRVIDPAGGSYFIEELTAQLCEKAWSIFQSVEAQGGMIAALRNGAIQSDIEAVYKARSASLAKRKQAITGVNQFPNLDEAALDPLPEMQPPAATPGSETIVALPVRPDAQAFEELRDLSDAFMARQGKRPALFSANLGTIAQHTGRATFSANLFACGGVESIAGVGSVSPEELVTAYKQSGTSVAVICGSDALYEQHATQVASALRDAGAKWIVLAGRPGKSEADLREAGVQDFIYMGCNALDALARVWKQWEAVS
jgi:methylmalonyl-CoA mutase